MVDALTFDSFSVSMPRVTNLLSSIVAKIRYSDCLRKLGSFSKVNG